MSEKERVRDERGFWLYEPVNLALKWRGVWCMRIMGEFLIGSGLRGVQLGEVEDRMGLMNEKVVGYSQSIQ